jgi:hypothetical protein
MLYLPQLKIRKHLVLSSIVTSPGTYKLERKSRLVHSFVLGCSRFIRHAQYS